MTTPRTARSVKSMPESARALALLLAIAAAVTASSCRQRGIRVENKVAIPYEDDFLRFPEKYRNRVVRLEKYFYLFPKFFVSSTGCPQIFGPFLVGRFVDRFQEDRFDCF